MRHLLLAAVMALLLVPAARAQGAFVPGDVVLFQEDFTAPKGEGFKRLRDVSPRISLSARDGKPYVHIRTPGRFRVPLPSNLPERFTIEFDVVIPGENHVWVGAAGNDGLSGGTAVAYFSPHSLSYAAGGDEGKVLEADEFTGGDARIGRVMRLALAVDGPKAQMFVDGKRWLEADAPAFGRSRAVHFEFGGVEDPTLLDTNVPIWITNIRVAAFADKAK